MDRENLLAPLGRERLRILDCFGGNEPRAPGYFDLQPDEDIFTAFREYAERMSRNWINETDPTTVPLLAAARLLSGELNAADIIIANLPAEMPSIDHGAGFCITAPQHSLSTALPIPPKLSDIRLWTAGSTMQSSLQVWLDSNRKNLQWNNLEGVYQYRDRSHNHNL
jgi:hypothetical protein